MYKESQFQNYSKILEICCSLLVESEGVFSVNRNMKLSAGVRETENKDYAAKLYAVMEKNGGYCPCRLQHTEENRCICAEFLAQIADADFEGFCHCKLYYKEKK